MKDDLISRRKAIDATWFEPSYTDPLNVLTEVRDRLEALPSAKSEQKKGKWMLKKVYEDEYGNEQFSYFCSECGAQAYEFKQHYCHRCGAPMEVK